MTKVTTLCCNMCTYTYSKQLYACICVTMHYVHLFYVCMYIHVIHNYTGIYTFAALNGSESYETLRDGLIPVVQEINELLKQREILIDGKMITLKIYYDADYKVKETYTTFSYSH